MLDTLYPVDQDSNPVCGVGNEQFHPVQIQFTLPQAEPSGQCCQKGLLKSSHISVKSRKKVAKPIIWLIFWLLLKKDKKSY